MKLQQGLNFIEFSCPELELQLGAGIVTTLDKEEFSVAANGAEYLISRTARYYFKVGGVAADRRHPFWKAGF